MWIQMQQHMATQKAEADEHTDRWNNKTAQKWKPRYVLL